ncbi:hypothetical protein ACEN2J_15675 [Pseudorhodobacter sp. W20_MBD10_FR17]|uniref:hypothetical protein n=1 Tax=Pseudorhodobacter sp. W20_MBD10_FR17 TaxID=3240266 RepID=UPI003F95AEE4
MQITSAASYMQNATQQSSKLTVQQGQKLNEFLTNYDSSNLSENDAKEIVSQIKELGIKAGSSLATALETNGIDAKGLAELAGVQGAEGTKPSGPPPGGGQGGPGGAGGPPPSGGKGRDSVDDTAVSLISDVLESYTSAAETDGTTQSFWSVLEPALQAAGYDTTKSVIDFYA